MAAKINTELGTDADLKVLTDESWLNNAQVSYHIEHKKGRWHLSMLFIHQKNPLKLRIRYLENYSTETQATRYAKLFQRGIQRDARGTFKTNYDAFNFCKN